MSNFANINDNGYLTLLNKRLIPFICFLSPFAWQTALIDNSASFGEKHRR